MTAETLRKAPQSPHEVAGSDGVNLIDETVSTLVSNIDEKPILSNEISLSSHPDGSTVYSNSTGDAQQAETSERMHDKDVEMTSIDSLKGSAQSIREKTVTGKFSNSATQIVSSDSINQEKTEQGTEEREIRGEKYLKTLELAMVELRPMPKPTDETDHKLSEGCEIIRPVEENADHGRIEHEQTSQQKQINVEEPDTNTVTKGEQSNEYHSTEALAVDGATVSLDHSDLASWQPKILVLKALNLANSDGGGQRAGTIVSDTRFEKEPLDNPRPNEAVKADTKQGINSATVKASSHDSASISPTAHGTKEEKVNCQAVKHSSKTVDCSTKNPSRDINAVSNTHKKDSTSGVNLASVLLPNLGVVGMNMNSNDRPVLKQSARPRPPSRDKCRSGQRVLTKTGCPSRGNHYQNSTIPATASPGHKCFPLNKVANRDYSHGTASAPLASYERPYGKKELRRALPRKSNFSCHDSAMKEAGFEDESIAQRKAERLKERLARVASSMNPLLGMTNYVATGCVQADVQVVVTDESSKTENQGGEADSKDIDAVATRNLPAIVPDASSSLGLYPGESAGLEAKDESGPLRHLLGGPGGGGETTGGTRRRRPGSARIEYVECKPLSQYLEYIRDNRQEYLNYIRHQQQQQQASRKDKAVATLIKMGQAFELRHKGGISGGKRLTAAMIADNRNGPPADDGELGTDVIVLAAKALRPRSANPGKFSKTRDKSGGSRRGAEAASRPLSEDKRPSPHHEKSTQSPNTAGGTGGGAGVGGPGHGAKEEEHPKTELEKRKLRAEDWTRSVPTHTLTRARIQSLKELGADDAELTKWWEALKGCHYLRQNICNS